MVKYIVQETEGDRRPQDQESATSDKAKKALSYRQDHRSCFKSDLQCI